MQLDKLQIELRPRSPAQALDLGFALLRSHAYAAYMTYAVLMLPFALVAALLTAWQPEYADWLIIIPWWFSPIIERGTLYVLSRRVFGENVSWQAAVRAWPSQLGGGVISLLTWFRPFSAGRSFIQPIWQLENARGTVASERRCTLGASGTSRSAFWFGVVLALLEAITQVGLFYFIASLVKPDNPFRAFEGLSATAGLWLDLGHVLIMCVVLAVFAPIYTACGFTLYLNRRASLEAWDIEIKLRQIVPPAASMGGAKKSASFAVAAALFLCTLTLGTAPDATAAGVEEFPTRAACMQVQQFERLPVTDAEQQRARAQVDKLYANEPLRSTECVERWAFRNKDKKKTETQAETEPGPALQGIAEMLKYICIALAVGGLAWLLYHYRGYLPVYRRGGYVPAATQVGGLDIRAESLPVNITDEVMTLWSGGEQRAALALLYRATLSRMVTEDQLQIRHGATEGDCLRNAERACAAQRMGQGRFDVARTVTGMWLDAAYGDRWPAADAVRASCSQWDSQFPTLAGAAA